MWLWILGSCALLLLLLLCSRIGVVIFFEETVRFQIRYGFFRFSFKTEPDKTAQTEEKTKKNEKKPQKDRKTLAKKLPKVTFSEVKDAIAALTPVGLRALRRSCKRISIKPLRLSITLAHSDPSCLAQSYGYANALLWSLLPQLENLLVIPDPRIHLGMDFEREKTELRGEIGCSIRMGDILAIAWSMGFATLKWFLKFRKRQPKIKQAQAAKPAA